MLELPRCPVCYCACSAPFCCHPPTAPELYLITAVCLGQNQHQQGLVLSQLQEPLGDKGMTCGRFAVCIADTLSLLIIKL